MPRTATGRARGRPAMDPDHWSGVYKVQAYFNRELGDAVQAVADAEDEGVMARAVRRLCREALEAREAG